MAFVSGKARSLNTSCFLSQIIAFSTLLHSPPPRVLTMQSRLRDNFPQDFVLDADISSCIMVQFREADSPQPWKAREVNSVALGMWEMRNNLCQKT